MSKGIYVTTDVEGFSWCNMCKAILNKYVVLEDESDCIVICKDCLKKALEMLE